MSLDASLLFAAASAAAGRQQYPAGALYVVATPIGNLADITLRALHVLSLVDAVACEDTRVTGALLRAYGLDKPLVALHEHNERAASARVIERLARGERVAYVSDAGTPAVSDPGAVLVAEVAAAGQLVVPVPGASSVAAALSAAGDGGATAFAFAGFLPARGAEREAALRAIAASSGSQVMFEAPHRIEPLARSLAALAGERRVTVCRELTKQFETVATMPARELPAWLAADAHRTRGEFVLVLHARPAERSDDSVATRALDVLLRDLPLKQAVALAAEIGGAPRNALYRRALALRGSAAAGRTDDAPAGGDA